MTPGTGARLRHLARRLLRMRQPHLALARWLGRPLPDRLYLALGHLAYFGRWPDYDRPRTLNEHIQAYMLRGRSPGLRVAADKLATRELVRRIGGEALLVPLLGVWSRAQDVPLETLPRPCVLKGSAGSGQVIFLRPDRREDPAQLRLTLQRWLDTDYSLVSREWCYRGVPRRILAEALLADPAAADPLSPEAIPADHKLYVIGGRVRFIQVDRGRFGRHTRNLYDTGWRLLPHRLTLPNHPADPRPRRLAEMIDLAERLAEGYEFLRVDAYLLPAPDHPQGERLLIGELTNYPGAGFERFIPTAYAHELGAHWPAPPG